MRKMLRLYIASLFCGVETCTSCFCLVVSDQNSLKEKQLFFSQSHVSVSYVTFPGEIWTHVCSLHIRHWWQSRNYSTKSSSKNWWVYWGCLQKNGWRVTYKICVTKKPTHDDFKESVSQSSLGDFLILLSCFLPEPCQFCFLPEPCQFSLLPKPCWFCSLLES